MSRRSSKQRQLRYINSKLIRGIIESQEPVVVVTYSHRIPAKVELGKNGYFARFADNQLYQLKMRTLSFSERSDSPEIYVREAVV